MRFDGQARCHVAGDDELVAKLPCLPRGCLDADMRRDAAEDDRSYPTALQFGIEVGAEERAPGRLGDENVARLGKAGREVGKAGGQDPRQREGLVDLPLRPVEFWQGVHRHHTRPRSAKPVRQHFPPGDQIVGGDRSKIPAENPALQVDQDESGRLWIECDHRWALMAGVAQAGFMRDTHKS